MSQRRYTTEQKLEIVERYENGESRNSIAKKTGISLVTIRSWIEKKEELISLFFEESRNKKGGSNKKRYSEHLKKIVVNRILNGEGIYRMSQMLEIPYLTIKNWVVMSQNNMEGKDSLQISIPNTDDVIISDEEKAQLRDMIVENAKNNNSHEDSLLRNIEQQNIEIAELHNRISELEDEIMMLKKSAILLAKKAKVDVENE